MSGREPRSDSAWQHEQASLRLVDWPLRDHPLVSGAVLAILVAIAVAAGIVSDSAAMGLLAMASLLVASWRRWLPVTFELGPRGVVQSILGRRRRIMWREFGRYERCGRGILLLPSADPAPLDPLRGLYIRAGEHQKETMELVDNWLARQNGSPSGSRYSRRS